MVSQRNNLIIVRLLLWGFFLFNKSSCYQYRGFIFHNIVITCKSWTLNKEAALIETNAPPPPLPNCSVGNRQSFPICLFTTAHRPCVPCDPDKSEVTIKWTRIEIVFKPVNQQNIHSQHLRCDQFVRLPHTLKYKTWSHVIASYYPEPNFSYQAKTYFA